MVAICKNAKCGKRHDPLLRCDDQRVANIEPAVVHSNVTGSSLANTGSSRHGKYADVEARKAYRKEWMRKRRAMVKPTPADGIAPDVDAEPLPAVG